jgi:hypothetical protein
MKAIKDSPELVIANPDDGKVGDETTMVQPDHHALVFKGMSLEELLVKSAELQSIIALSRPWEVYELDARYDIETGEWTGQLYNIKDERILGA